MFVTILSSTEDVVEKLIRIIVRGAFPLISLKLLLLVSLRNVRENANSAYNSKSFGMEYFTSFAIDTIEL